MPLPELQQPDVIRMMHMRDAARQALEFAVGRDRNSLDSGAMYRRAEISCIQEIGEAAVRVTADARTLLPGLPWRQITDMRNRLVHAYFNVNLNLVFEVLARDPQPLLTEVERALM